MLVQSLTR